MNEQELMNADGRPVVENAARPVMGDQNGLMDPVPAIDSTRSTTTGSESGAEAGVASMDTQGEPEDPMDAAPPNIETPRTFDADGDDVGDGYLRLVVRLEAGSLSVIGARIVDGLLLQPPPTGEMHYVAAIGERQVGAGGLPDLLEERGFAPEDDPTAGHGIAPSDGNEFVVRIPRQDITADELAELEIRLLRPPSTSASTVDGESFEPSGAPRGGDAEQTVIARLSGVDFGSAPNDQAQAVVARLR